MSSELAIPDVEIEPMPTPANLFGTQNPAEVVARSSEIATALADVLKSKNLAKKIGNRSFVLVEGWTLLGTMLGVFPVVEWTRPVDDGWEARVEARTLTGQVVGSAEAECLRSESNWKNRDDYALRSMAQTRAVSKALRGPLGFIVTLAGYEATPAEEIPPSDTAPMSESTADVKEARKNLAAALKHAKEHGVLPPGHDDWDAFTEWLMNSRYNVADSKKLTAEQTNQLAAHLLEQDIPL